MKSLRRMVYRLGLRGYKYAEGLQDRISVLRNLFLGGSLLLIIMLGILSLILAFYEWSIGLLIPVSLVLITCILIIHLGFALPENNPLVRLEEKKELLKKLKVKYEEYGQFGVSIQQLKKDIEVLECNRVIGKY
jgi:hypothetical protein